MARAELEAGLDQLREDGTVSVGDVVSKLATSVVAG
jgi:hypothetical protein